MAQSGSKQRPILQGVVVLLGVIAACLVFVLTRPHPVSAPRDVELEPEQSPQDSSGSKFEQLWQAGNDVLSIVGSTPERGRLSSQTEDRDTNDESWSLIQRNNKDVFRIFARAPSTVEADWLLRNVHLNPVDTYVPLDARLRLRSLIDAFQKHLQEISLAAASERNRALEFLDAAGALGELRPGTASIPQDVWEAFESRTRSRHERFSAVKRASGGEDFAWIADDYDDYLDDQLVSHARELIPNAGAFLTRAEGTWFATDEQLGPTYASYVQYRAHMRETFFAMVSAWFVSEGLLSSGALLSLLEEFERHS